MAAELNPIDLNNAPSLPELVDEVRTTRKSRIIRVDGEAVAELRPVPKRRSLRNAKPVTADDPLMSVIGIGHSGKGDISSNKHKYLAEAYAPKKE